MNKKVMKIILWIFMFPFMIGYKIYKADRIKKQPKIAILSIYSLILLSLFNSSNETSTAIDVEDNITAIVEENQSQELEAADVFSEVANISEDVYFEGYSFIEVDGGDLSGHREKNVVVDIGFGDRKYYAFTNEYGQLVKVIADEIILQDDSSEEVTAQGRYYSDEAKVPGTESATLDEGHIIADSLGGVSNAYNITPQESTLNRYGDQAYMERGIREAGGCSDFLAIITYPDTTSQIPSHYSFTYTLMGTVISDEFDNVNPDDNKNHK